MDSEFVSEVGIQTKPRLLSPDLTIEEARTILQMYDRSRVQFDTTFQETVDREGVLTNPVAQLWIFEDSKWFTVEGSNTITFWLHCRTIPEWFYNILFNYPIPSYCEIDKVRLALHWRYRNDPKRMEWFQRDFWQKKSRDERFLELGNRIYHQNQVF